MIDSNDLKELMKNIGKQLNDKEILEMILEADKNGDGVVDYEGTLFLGRLSLFFHRSHPLVWAIAPGNFISFRPRGITQ